MRQLYKILIVLLYVACCSSAFSQVRTVTFTGRDKTNQYHIPLSKVTVFNLDQLWEDVLYYPDTVLILGTVGVENYEAGQDIQLMQNIPNPFDGVTEFALQLPENRDVMLEIYDVTGRLAVGQRFTALSAGTHLFQATLSSPQTYLLSAKVDNGQMTIKMVNKGYGAGNTIRHLGMTDKNGDFTIFLNSEKASNGYPFQVGDEMKYTGYAIIGGSMRESGTILVHQYDNETIPLLFDYTLPSLVTKTISNITSTTAVCGGNVTNTGGTPVTARGVCWSTSPNPTVNNNHTTNGNGTGGFTSNLTGLSAGTTYYVRAYATNSVGTQYGGQRSFTTYSLPTVTTNTVSNVASTTATCGGNVTSTGGTNVTARGVCWSTSQNPTVNGSHTTNGTGTGSFNSDITGLTPNTTYYVRAYAKNSVGTAYGDRMNFTTLCDTLTTDITVAECDSFIWDGVEYTTTPAVALTHTFSTIHGCDSIVTLHLTINHSTHNVETVEACDSYEWHGATYMASGTYTSPYTNADGCESMDTLKLTVNTGTHNVETVTVCESYEWHGTNYTSSGTYTYPYINANGCESEDTLKLTVHYSTHNVETVTACESYEWHGTTYTSSGTYTYPYTNADGCESVDTLKLTVNQSSAYVSVQTACNSFTWIDGNTYTSSTNTPTYILENVAGCDSVVTLHLTINHPQHQSLSVTAYDSYIWTEGDEQTYTVSGIYYYSHLDANGCTQVDTLFLTVFYSSSNEFSATACESYEWDGMTYSSSGDYARQYTDIHGADSIVTLHLTINHGSFYTYTDTVCESDYWHGMTYNESGTYIYSYTNADGCESVDTLKLTVYQSVTGDTTAVACGSFFWHGIEYTATPTVPPTHTYQTVNGCDSVVTLHLSIIYSDI